MKISVTIEMTNHSMYLYGSFRVIYEKSEINGKSMDCQGPPSKGFLKNLNIHLQTVKVYSCLG